MSSSYAKNTLILMRYPGKFLKSCQGSGAEICCNYFVVSYAWNCHLECTYCVLQSYLSSEALVVCTNIEELLLDVKSTLEQSPERIFRIGTGELADSLALDHLTHYSRRLGAPLAALPNGILELKTKTNQISNLQDLDHNGHTVLSWSMNSKHICRTEECNAATFEERLSAAVQCQEWGYKIGFHFDPLVHHEGWEEGYREAVREIFRAVNPEGIAWISLGALRFPRICAIWCASVFRHPRFPMASLSRDTMGRTATSGRSGRRCIAKCAPGFVPKHRRFLYIFAWKTALFGSRVSARTLLIHPIFPAGWTPAYCRSGRAVQIQRFPSAGTAGFRQRLRGQAQVAECRINRHVTVGLLRRPGVDSDAGKTKTGIAEKESASRLQRSALCSPASIRLAGISLSRKTHGILMSTAESIFEAAIRSSLEFCPSFFAHSDCR